jgi:PEP-CTERM motif
VKAQLKSLTIIACCFGAIFQLHSQSYIVPNGVVTDYYHDSPGEVSVAHDPTNLYYTGFLLQPVGKTQPTVYTNTFLFNPIVDVGVRVFLVSSNDPISLQQILLHNYTELNPQNYVFNSGVPFYVGLYTGNQSFAPPNGIYRDPLFGWAKLVNNQGVIQLLDSALEYQGGGIYAGTQTIIPVPEPNSLAMLGASALLLSFFRRRNSSR